MMPMRAAIAVEPGAELVLQDCELDSPLPHEIVVQIDACGICHTDLVARDGGLPLPMPVVLGHEGVGTVRDAGSEVQDLAAGDRVLLSFGHCGTCPRCQAQLPAYCQHAWAHNLRCSRADGTSALRWRGSPLAGYFFGQSSFATHCVVDARQAVRLDPDLPAHLMAPLACGVQTGMGAVMNVLRPLSSVAVAVSGCGTVGLSAIMAARLSGCRAIAAVDVLPARLELALQLGATHACLSSETGLTRTLRKLDIRHALDTTGASKVIEGILDILQPQGTVVCAGLGHGEPLRVHPTMLATTGKSLRGTVEGDAEPSRFVPRMVQWYREGRLPLERLVRVYPFEQINEAIDDMRAGRAVKPVLTWSPL